MTQKLVDVETIEVSLVDSPANKRQFILFKSENGKKEGDDDPTNGEEDIKKEGEKMTLQNLQKTIGEELGQLDDEQVELLYGQIRGLWTETALDALLEMGESIVTSMVARELDVDFEDPFIQAMDIAPVQGAFVKKSEEEDDKGKEEIEKQISEEAQNAILGAMRILQDYWDEVPEELILGLAELIEDPDALEEFEEIEMRKFESVVKGLEKEEASVVEKLFKERRELKKEMAKAKEKEELAKINKRLDKFDNLTIDKEELAKEIYKVQTICPDSIDHIEKALKSANEAVKTQDVFKEIGTTQVPDGSNSWEKIEKMAEEYANKKDISKEKAINVVLKKEPKLYAKYLSERSGQ